MIALPLCAGGVAALSAGLEPVSDPEVVSKQDGNAVDPATGLPVELVALMAESRCGSGDKPVSGDPYSLPGFQTPVRVAETYSEY